MTNFELIKNMNIDEMASSDFYFFGCPYGTPFKNCKCHDEFGDDCDSCVKHWLESDVIKESEHNYEI